MTLQWHGACIIFTLVAQRGRLSNPPFPSDSGTADGPPATDPSLLGGLAAPQSTLLATLLQALEDYYRFRDANDAEGRARFAAISAWFEDRNTGARDGFEAVCQRVQLNADFIRQMIRNRTETPSD